MHLDTIYDEFMKNVADLCAIQRDSQAIFNNEIKRLNERSKTVDESLNINSKNMGNSIHRFKFTNLRTNKTQGFGLSKRTPREHLVSAFLLKNKQYQWLLVDIYEEYEDFLEMVYAFIGYKNKELWPLEDFGNTRWAELENKDFNFYLSKVRPANGRSKEPKKIVNELRKMFPTLKELEGDEISIKLVMTFIEKMRHIIVHLKGQPANKENFIKSVLKDSGYHYDCDSESYKFIAQFFGKNKNNDIIMLLEVPVKNDLFELGVYHDVFNIFVNDLVAYSTAIYEDVRDHFLTKK